MNTEFDISKFNIIQDEENYYFFRALNMGDSVDIENGITATNGEIDRIRTDRARWIENPENHKAKFTETDEISLEQMYDHIKMHQRKDTNCISLSSNANVSISYGRGNYKDKYVLVKVPKSELGYKVKVAGEYMLSEIEKRVQSEIDTLSSEGESELLERIKRIDEAASTDEIVDAVFTNFSFTGEEKVYTAKNGKKITAQNMKGRFSNYQALSESQNLEKNKLYAKLTVLEYFAGMERLIPRTGNNSNLLATVGLAFSSLELINYGDIEKESFTEVPSKVMDMLSILQQAREKISDVDQEKLERKQKIIEDLESKIIGYVTKGYDLKTQDGELVFTNGEEKINLGNSGDKSITSVIDNYEEPSIEELYNLTNGGLSYEKARSLIQKSYYASRAKLRANEIIEVISQIAGESEETITLLNEIKNECFVVDPKIISKQSDAGYKLSESISIAASQDEINLINEIKKLSDEELKENIHGSIEENARRIIKIHEQESQDKNTYYAEAIVSLYDFEKVGIKFTDAQHELFISKLKELELPKIYENVRNAGVAQTEITKVILNICMNEKFKELINTEDFENQIKENIEELSENLYSEQIEDFLGFYDIEGTGIKLKDYQKRGSDNIDKIYENKRFAVAIMPTGSGKSFLAMAEMLKEKYNLFDPDAEKRKKMLYVAPSNEILEQFINNLVENVIGTKESLGKTNAQLLKEKFPNLEFTTYANLKSVAKKKYDLIILDELHRTGAKEWGKHLEKLLKNQDESTKILGITATPERDVDGRNMADELALELGYTEEEVKQRKHVAIKMDLMDAIRNGIVVNPNLITCEYNALTNERFINLEQEINEIEDEGVRKVKLAEYEELRRNLSNADGVKEILNNNLKIGGKYIVFIPVGDDGEEVEDEFGNKTSKKSDAEAKVQAQIKELEKHFEGTGKKIKCYSMLGAYSDKENSKNLHGFENGAKDEINFLVVINKANEGLHIKGVSGIIWFRALDKNSRILMLQQMGRCIYALDENNPLPEDKIPIIIDLPNNTMTVDFQKAINTYTDVDDLEMLRDIIDWMEKHNGNLPNIESKGKEEQRKAITLKRIQEKYLKYYEENFEDLDEEEIERINQILDLGEEIDLWNLELPDKKDKDGKAIPVEKLINIENFRLEGNLKKLCELEENIDKINSLKRTRMLINKLEEWCYENFGDDEKPKCKTYERHMPRHLAGVRIVKDGEKETKEQEEYRLSIALRNNSLIKAYKQGKEIPDGSRELIVRYEKIAEKYTGNKLVVSLEKVVNELEEWCIENFGDEENSKYKRYERHLPQQIKGLMFAKEGEKETKEQKENRIAHAIGGNILIKAYKQGKGVPEEAKNLIKRYEKIVEEYSGNKLIVNLEKVVSELEEWCIENFGDDDNPKCEVYERHMPKFLGNGRKFETEVENINERREYILAKNIYNNSLIKAHKQGEEIPEEAMEFIERYIKIVEKYTGNELVIKLKKVVDELEKWCIENFGDDENPKCKSYEKHMPRLLNGIKVAEEGKEETKEQEEYKLALAIKNNSLIKSYNDGKEIPKEAKDLMERYIKIKEIYTVNKVVSNLEKLLDELEEWCIENFGDEENPKCKTYERHMPRRLKKVRIATEGEKKTKEQEEYELAMAIRKNSLIKAYKQGEEIPEEAIELIERYKNLGKKYTGNELVVNLEKIVNELEEWCVENFGDVENPKCERDKRYMPRHFNNVVSAKGREETKEQREKRLAESIFGNTLIKAYKKGEEIPEEAKELIEKYKKIEEMCISEEQRNMRKPRKKVVSQSIGKATYDVSTEACEEAETVVKELLQEQSKEGEINEN